MHMYVFLFAYKGFLCSILYESAQYSISQYDCLVNRQFYEYINVFDKKKKKNVNLGSNMWGLIFTMSCSIKMYLNKFKVYISSLPRRSPSKWRDLMLAMIHMYCTNYNAVVSHT